MIKNWKKLKESSTKVGFRKILTKTFKLPNNKLSDWYIKQEEPSVCILGITKDNNIILAKQFRPGPEKILLELPGGMIDKNETPIEAAKREFLEETGYSGDFKFVGENFACSYSTRIRHNFVATNCHKIQKQTLDKNEFIETLEMSLDDFRKHIQSGQLTDVETAYLGLDYLKLL